MKKLIYVTIFLAFAMSCVKEGPMGPPGPQGDPGPGGTQAYTIIMDVYGENWTVDGQLAFAEFEVPRITQAISESGAVFVYYLKNTADNLFEWEPLPYTEPGGGLTETFYHSPGYLVLQREITAGEISLPNPGEYDTYKVLIVEGIPY